MLQIPYCLMALNNSFPFYTYNYYILLILAIPLFLSSVFALPNHHDPSSQTRGLLHEAKSRLGSRPPSCYNKCNQCRPCKAVQVPSLPSFNRVETPKASQPPSPVASSEYDLASGDNNRYSNYKPLGWKCRCRDNFYNP